jgi:hypothetical protein
MDVPVCGNPVISIFFLFKMISLNHHYHPTHLKEMMIEFLQIKMLVLFEEIQSSFPLDEWDDNDDLN